MKAEIIRVNDDLLKALASLVDELLTYDGNRIVIDCASHSDAMQRVRLAREALAKARGES